MSTFGFSFSYCSSRPVSLKPITPYMPMVMTTLPSFLPPPVADSSLPPQPTTSESAPAVARAATVLLRDELCRVAMVCSSRERRDAPERGVADESRR
ncbi:hypothetical protein SGLAM104S_08057 [Streptomyces glaucescens]